MPVSDVNVTATFREKGSFSDEYDSEDFDTSLCSFYDKFDGDSLDTTKWGYQNGNGHQYGNGGWGNNELQCYRPENVIVSDGILRIEARSGSNTWRDTNNTSGTSRTFQYSSGKIVSANSQSEPGNKFSQTYGRFEAKIRMTRSAGGMWPAFWMMPVSSAYGGWPRSGEIDIMEMVGPQPTHASGTIHFQAIYGAWEGRQYRGAEHTFENNSRFTDWHVYGVVWNQDELILLIDGKRIRRLARTDWNTSFYNNPSAPFDKDFHLIFNLAVGGNFGNIGAPVPAEFPWAMEIEWVRVYTEENDPWEVTDSVPSNLVRNY
jgi:beta-glucanase (GH16 family)